MPSLTLNDQLIWFAHCPKAGGTSLEQAMVQRWGDAVGHLHWGWDLWWQRGGWRTADPPNSPQHLTWADAQSCLPRAPDAVFAMVRDPVTRMISEYRWQRHHRRGRRAGRLLARLPFGLWLRLMLAVVRINPHAFDNHLRPQSAFIPEGAMVFRFENGLQPAFEWLEQVVAASASGPLPHALPGGGTAVCLTSADRARIGAAFAADYDRFGYARPEGAAPCPDVLDRVVTSLAPAVTALERRGRI